MDDACAPVEWRDRRDARLVTVKGVALVYVCDGRDISFKVLPEPYLALEVYDHPFAYGNFATIDYEKDSGRAAYS